MNTIEAKKESIYNFLVERLESDAIYPDSYVIEHEFITSILDFEDEDQEKAIQQEIAEHNNNIIYNIIYELDYNYYDDYDNKNDMLRFLQNIEILKMYNNLYIDNYKNFQKDFSYENFIDLTPKQFLAYHKKQIKQRLKDIKR